MKFGFEDVGIAELIRKNLLPSDCTETWQKRKKGW